MIRFVKVLAFIVVGSALACSSSPSSTPTGTPDAGATDSGTATDSGSAFENNGFFECYLTIQHTDQTPPYTTRWCREQNYPPGQGVQKAIEANCKMSTEMVTQTTESTTEHCPAPTTPSTSCTKVGSATTFSDTWDYDIFAGIASNLTAAQLAEAQQAVVSIYETTCNAYHGVFTTYLLGVGADGGSAADAAGDAGAD